MKHFLSCMLVAGLLCSCGHRPTEIKTVPVPVTVVHPNPPESVQLNDVNWHVVTKNNIDAFAAEAVKDQGTSNPVFVIITTDDYKTLMGNFAELKRYIEQQQSIIAYYEKATTPTAGKATVAENNTSATAAADTSKTLAYVARNGDTLFNISRRFKIDVRQLAKINNMTLQTRLQVGQQLLLPAESQPVQVMLAANSLRRAN